MEAFENLPEYQALVVAATAKSERRMGDAVIPAEPVQWKEVRTIAHKLLDANTNQLALYIYLVQAETSINGFNGLLDSLNAIFQLLDGRWDDLHPKADLEDPDDMYFARINLMNELSQQPEFLDAIYHQPLVNVRGIGEFSTRDLDISSGLLTGSTEDQARCQGGVIRGAFTETEPDELLSLSRTLNALPDICRSIESVFDEKSGTQGLLSLENLRERVEACRQRFHEIADEFLSSGAAVNAANDDSAVGMQSSETTSLKEVVISSTLADREMVMASFNAVLVYYEQYEPSSPVRVLTATARDFVNKSFFEVIQAMAPNYNNDLSAMLSQLSEKPLVALLSDSYSRHLSGESLPVMSSIASQDANQQNPIDNEGDGNRHNPVVITSRDQVLGALQDIAAYFTNAEPSSPIPLIVTDISELVPKRFMDLVADLSRALPESADKVDE